MCFAAVHESDFGSAPRRRGLPVEEDSQHGRAMAHAAADYPNYKTVHRRFQTWCRDEVLRRVLSSLEYHAHNFLGFVQLACLVILFKRF